MIKLLFTSVLFLAIAVDYSKSTEEGLGFWTQTSKAHRNRKV